MNKIVNEFLSGGEKFMLELHLGQPGFTIALVDHLLCVVKEFKNSKEQVI